MKKTHKKTPTKKKLFKKIKKKQDLTTIGLIVIIIVLSFFLTVIYYQPTLLTGMLKGDLTSPRANTINIVKWAQQAAVDLKNYNLSISPEKIHVRGGVDTLIEIDLNQSDKNKKIALYKEANLFMPGSPHFWTVNVTGEKDGNWVFNNAQIPITIAGQIPDGTNFILFIDVCEVQADQSCEIQKTFQIFPVDTY